MAILPEIDTIGTGEGSYQMRDIRKTIGVLTDLAVAPEETLPKRFLEPKRCGYTAINLRRCVFAMHVHFFRGHPVDVKLGTVDSVVNLE